MQDVHGRPGLSQKTWFRPPTYLSTNTCGHLRKSHLLSEDAILGGKRGTSVIYLHFYKLCKNVGVFILDRLGISVKNEDVTPLFSFHDKKIENTGTCHSIIKAAGIK